MTRRLLSYLNDADQAEALAYGFGVPPEPALTEVRRLWWHNNLLCYSRALSSSITRRTVELPTPLVGRDPVDALACRTSRQNGPLDLLAHLGPPQTLALLPRPCKPGMHAPPGPWPAQGDQGLPAAFPHRYAREAGEGRIGAKMPGCHPNCHPKVAWGGLLFFRYVFGLLPVAVFVWRSGGLSALRTVGENLPKSKKSRMNCWPLRVGGYGHRFYGYWEPFGDTERPDGSAFSVAHAAMLYTNHVLFLPQFETTRDQRNRPKRACSDAKPSNAPGMATGPPAAARPGRKDSDSDVRLGAS